MNAECGYEIHEDLNTPLMCCCATKSFTKCFMRRNNRNNDDHGDDNNSRRIMTLNYSNVENKYNIYQNSILNIIKSTNTTATIANNMQVLLVFSKEDASLLTLKLSIQKCGYKYKQCASVDDACKLFTQDVYDIVIIDTRLQLAHQMNGTSNELNYETICKAIRKICIYTVIVAFSHKLTDSNDKEVPSVLPLLKLGFNRILNETLNASHFMNELQTLEYGEVANMHRLKASYSLFTALEYTSDPVEIMNESFKILYVNQAYEKLTGLTLNELTGKDFSDIHACSDTNVETIKEQMLKGNSWEGCLQYTKSSGDKIAQQTLTLPVHVSGCNKITNFIAVCYPSSKISKSTKNGTKTTKAPMVDPLPTSTTINFLPSTSSTSLPVVSLDMLLKERQNSAPLHTHARFSAEFNAIQHVTQRKRSYDLRSNAILEGLSFPRRHSMARVHALAVEAPITKVINILLQIQEKAVSNEIKQNIDKAFEILRSTELYNPITLLHDKHTCELVEGLMSNGIPQNGTKTKHNSRTDLLILPQKQPQLPQITSSHLINSLPEAAHDLLRTCEHWSFDIIALERLTLKRPLITLGLKIFTRFNVCEYLKCDENTIVNWLQMIEANYRPSNAYHNSTHATDVLHATAYFLETNKLKVILDDTDRVGSLLAAAVHDLNHPGRTNAFLCNSNNELAVLYNDQAVLENHHAALAFTLTHQNTNVNIFKNLTRDEYRAVRSVIIDMVLATEMNKHFEHLNKFINKFSVDEENPIENFDDEHMKSAENRLLIKRILIKCADVSNPCRPLTLCKEWAFRIAEEYFEQTDEEKAKSLPVVMGIFDRTSCNIPKTQISFIEYFIANMFQAWHEFLDIQEMMDNLEQNTNYWKDQCDKPQQQQQQASTDETIKEDNEENEQ